MRFLLLLFLCLSHLAFSVDITISTFSIDGKTYKNPTVSYKEGATMATVFYDDGVASVHISQIPHSILPKLGLSPEKVNFYIERHKTKVKEKQQKREAAEKLKKQALSEYQKILRILKNSQLAYFTPTEFLPELGDCYLGTFSFDTSKKIIVIIPSGSDYKSSDVVFRLNKKHPIMVVDAGTLPYNGKDLLAFRFVCEEFEYKDELRIYSALSYDEENDEESR